MNSIDILPLLGELDIAPTLEEVLQAIEKMPNKKAPGLDGIQAEILKCGKNILIIQLHSLLLRCWETSSLPHDLKDSSIVTLYKNKGDRSDCNNYRGISLLSTAGKIFERVCLPRLQRLAEQIYTDSQCGFRAERCTIDMIFSLRQLEEKCRDQKRSHYVAFVDLTKAFDLVSRDGVLKVLERIDCPPKLLAIIRACHVDMQATMQVDAMASGALDVAVESSRAASWHPPSSESFSVP